MTVPTRLITSISWPVAFTVTLALFFTQLALGTTATYAGYNLLYGLAAATAFNALRGFETAGGLAIVVIAIKGPFLAHIVKICLGESAQIGLADPIETMFVNAVGMVVLAVAALFVERLPRLPGATVVPVTSPQLRLLWIYSFAVWVLTCFSWDLGLPFALIKMLGYFTFAPASAISAATACCLIRSGRRRSMDLATAGTMVVIIVRNLSLGSKQAMVEAMLAWAITAVAFGFRFRRSHYASFFGIALVANFVIYPLVQMRESFAGGESTVERLTTAANLFGPVILGGDAAPDLLLNGNLRASLEAQSVEESVNHVYFGFDAHALERVILLPMAGRLGQAVEERGPIGWDRYWETIQLLPREFTGAPMPENLSNRLGHFAGVLQDDDLSTGISFGPFSENAASLTGAELLLVTFFAFVAYSYGATFIAPATSGNVWGVVVSLAWLHQVSDTSSLAQVFAVTRIFPCMLVFHAVFRFVGQHFAPAPGKYFPASSDT